MLKRADEVYGLIHLSVGQEGVAAAVCSQLRDDDAVYSGHRAHGHAIAKGAPLERVMAELMGRSDGLCRGLGGSMHLVDVEHGLMGATGRRRRQHPARARQRAGAQLRGGDEVAVVFFGDGAVQAGHFNESVNLAALWKLPLILVCENNGFAEFTPRSAHTNVERVCDVVAPYGLERETVDGNDVAAVWDAFGRFLAAARREGPAAARVPDLPAARPLRGRPRRSTARRSRPRSGSRRTRSCACSARARRPAGSPPPISRAPSARRARRSKRPSASRARVPTRQPSCPASSSTPAGQRRERDHLRQGDQRRRSPRRCAPTSACS